MTVNRYLLRRMIDNNGGVRKFSENTGLSRQAIYNTLNGKTPNYYTIRMISEGLQLTDEQLLTVWFNREGTMICPCKGCDKAGCGTFHDQCEPYIQWRSERDRINRLRAEEADNRSLSRDQEMKYRKNLKRGGRK